MDDLRKAYRINVIIGLAMMASLLVYLIVVGLVEQGIIEQARDEFLAGTLLETVKFVLLGISAILFFLIRAFNARVLNAEGEQGRTPDERTRPATGAPAEFGRLTTAAIVTYALCETPAIFGLVLFFLGGSSSDFHMFLLISLFSFAVHFPRYSQWEEWYRKQQGHGTGRGHTQE